MNIVHFEINYINGLIYILIHLEIENNKVLFSKSWKVFFASLISTHVSRSNIILFQ